MRYLVSSNDRRGLCLLTKHKTMYLDSTSLRGGTSAERRAEAMAVRVIVEGEVCRAPELCPEIGENWLAVASLDRRPDYWGRPHAPQRTVYRVRSRPLVRLPVLVTGDRVRVVGTLYLWGWYDRGGAYRHVAEVVSDAVVRIDADASERNEE